VRERLWRRRGGDVSEWAQMDICCTLAG